MITTILTPIALLAASVAAMACAYSALPSQRWWRRPLALFPARATAILAALVALRAWIDLLGPARGALAWFSTLALPLGILLVAGRAPRAAGSAVPGQLFTPRVLR